MAIPVLCCLVLLPSPLSSGEGVEFYCTTRVIGVEDVPLLVLVATTSMV